MEHRSSAQVRLVRAALYHGRRPVVHGVDLTLEPGVTALVGPNGAGKSTVLRAIATLHPIASGRLELGGRPVEGERDARRARRHLGYLEQDPSFPERFTVADAIAYAAWLHRLPAAEGAVTRVLERFGLDAVATTELRTLSGGTRRRALLAQAVVHDPRVLVLDEPTVGMDIEHRAALCADLRSLAVDRVVVLSTHLIDDLVGLEARVVVLAQGTVAFDGGLDEVGERARSEHPGAADSRLLELGLTQLASGSLR
jgi:ABC-type multidrug transport system ATPase subunit